MKKSIKIIGAVLFVMTGIFLFYHLYQVCQKTSVSTNPHVITGTEPEIREEIYRFRLAMVGDALYHDGVYKDGYTNGGYDFKKQLSQIKPIIETYDLAYYNQESILGGTSLGLSTYPRFNSPQEVGDAFIDAGFNLVSTANNHTLDRGEEAILNSYAYWKTKENVLMSGSCDSFLCMETIPVGEKNGITYAFLSYTTTTNGLRVPSGKEYLVNIYSEERVKSDIEKIKDQVDVILVAMHWGSEYHDYPVQEQKDIAHFLANMGVTIVIGNHPHVVEPIEKIGDTLVFYSFGNFISAQSGIDKLIGLLGSVTIEKKVVGEDVTISIPEVEAMLTYTSYSKSYRNFQVIPFSNLGTSILLNYETIEQKKQDLVTSFGYDIHWLV